MLTSSIRRGRLQELVQFLSYHPTIESDKVLHAVEEVLALALKENDQRGVMVANWALAINLFGRGELDKAEELLSTSLETAIDLNENIFKGRILSALGGIHCKRSYFSRGLEYLFEALEYIDPFWEGSTYNTIGIIYRNIGKLDKAVEFLQKAIQKAGKVNNTALHSSAMLNYGRVLIQQKKLDEAIAVLKNAIAISREHKYSRGEAFGLMRLAEVYTELDQPLKAIEVCKTLVELARKAGLPYMLAKGLQSHGKLCIAQGKGEQGLSMLKESYIITKDRDFKSMETIVLEDIAKYYESTGHYSEAYQFSQLALKTLREWLDEDEADDIRKKLRDKENQIFTLEKQKEKIAQQNSALKEYAYVVAHDLKEPLRNISGFAALLRRRLNLEQIENTEEYLNFIEKGAQHLYQQLEDLLIYSTIDENVSQDKEIRLSEVLNNVRSGLSTIIKETEASLEVAPLPIVRGVATHFHQIFQNLIHNSLKFRHPGRRPVIVVSVTERNRFLEFSIKDNGIGIPENYHENIFLIFKRLDKQNYSGTGIGLAICKKITQLYEGNIWLESTPGEGTTFYFTIKKENIPVAVFQVED